jgi:hypothetical protein
MANFFVTRRFELPVIKIGRGRFIDELALRGFWEICSEYADQRGCYVFSMKAAKGEKPFYVGKASVQTFRQECRTPHKLKIFNQALGSRRGTPYLSFVVLEKTRGKQPLILIDEVEEFLIAQAAARNKELLNRKGLPNQKWTISGVVYSGKGKRSTEVNTFRRIMGISS